jgi:vacuolar protein sorting-associated protein 13D
LDEQLVLDVPEGSRVVIGKKSEAKRSQLWRMTSTGLLQHEGSSPPQDPRKPVDQSRILVLDIAGPAVQPDDFVPLMLRRSDARRSLTQQWRFTEDGRLCCQHSGLYVQAKDGHLGLHVGLDVVLGPEAGLGLGRTDSGMPVEQSICRQRLRPGSGFLGVRVTTDGPTRVLQITDLRHGSRGFARAEEPDWRGSRRPWPVLPEGSKSGPVRGGHFLQESSRGMTGMTANSSNTAHYEELQVVLLLKGGLGISLVSNKEGPGEELLYISLTNILLDYQRLPSAQLLDGSVQTVQVDAQSPDAQLPVVLYLSPATKTDDGRHLPAIHFGISRTPSAAAHHTTTPTTGSHNNGGSNAEIFRHFILTVKNLTVNIEEELVYKLERFARHATALSAEEEGEEETEEVGGSLLELQLGRMAAASQLTRYYVGTLRLTLSQVRLSVQRTPKLRPDLAEVKRRLGLSLIAFEDATIDLGKARICNVVHLLYLF